jgi:hypothetical protein
VIDGEQSVADEKPWPRFISVVPSANVMTAMIGWMRRVFSATSGMERELADAAVICLYSATTNTLAINRTEPRHVLNLPPIGYLFTPPFTTQSLTR